MKKTNRFSFYPRLIVDTRDVVIAESEAVSGCACRSITDIDNLKARRSFWANMDSVPGAKLALDDLRVRTTIAFILRDTGAQIQRDTQYKWLEEYHNAIVRSAHGVVLGVDSPHFRQVVPLAETFVSADQDLLTRAREMNPDLRTVWFAPDVSPDVPDTTHEHVVGWMQLLGRLTK